MTTPASSPAIAEAREPAIRKRVPLSTPQRKLEVPEIPGRHPYWFLESNVPRALQGGYEFVHDKDVTLNQVDPATDTMESGNQDLGTQVKIGAGTDASGKAEYLVLMSIKEEWWQEDQKVLEARNASILSAIFKEEKIMGSDQVAPEDRDARYVKTAEISPMKPLFQRPTRKGK